MRRIGILILVLAPCYLFGQGDSITADVQLDRSVYAPTDTLLVFIRVVNHSSKDYTLWIEEPTPCSPVACIDTLGICSCPGWVLCPAMPVSYTIPASASYPFDVEIPFENLPAGSRKIGTNIGELYITPPLSPILSSFTIDPHVAVQYPFSQGWSLMSVPAVPSTMLGALIHNLRTVTLFPDACSPAFAYSDTSGYAEKDTLENGMGYWLRYPMSTTVTIKGGLKMDDTIPVTSGWNLIGSISYPISVTGIITIPPGLVASQFFGYQDGYYITDSIVPGQGYWVKVNQSGSLILSSTDSASANRIHIIAISELPPTPPDEQNQPGIAIPKEYALAQAFPSPFNPSTTIQYQLPSDSRVSLKIYNLLGQVVVSLVNQPEPAGYKSVNWNASSFASGIYFYRLEATSVANPGKTFTSMKKMVLMK